MRNVEAVVRFRLCPTNPQTLVYLMQVYDESKSMSESYASICWWCLIAGIGEIDV